MFIGMTAELSNWRDTNTDGPIDIPPRNDGDDIQPAMAIKAQGRCSSLLQLYS